VKSYTMSVPGLVFFVLCIILGITDLGFVVFTGTGTSLSAFLVSHGFTSPVMVFTFGAVCGHLFWYMSPVKIDAK
jgi:hypothetical protein